MLFTPQQEVMDQGLLTSGFNCILQMPTGSGKTWLAEQAMADALARGYRAIYLTPLRALAAEQMSHWQERFANHRVGVFTGDFGIPGRPYPVPFGEAQLLVMTPERLDACTRAWRNHWHWLPEVDLIIVDEFHLLGEPQRGARLEGALLRMQRLNPFARIIGLSATLGNRGELADWLQAVEYQSTWRPIPLTWRMVRYRKADEKPQLLAQEVRQTVAGGGRSLVFVQSRRRAEALSCQLLEAGLRAAHHHAGLAHTERRTVEAAFRRRETDVLVATGTLEMGLNLPVRQVILYDLQAFDGTDFRPLATSTVWQRVGRAGRRGLDTEGEALLFVPTWDQQPETYLLGNFEPIKSGLANRSALAEQIVAEVSSGLARTTQQLQTVFGHSLAARQERLPDVAQLIGEMQAAGMICATQAEGASTTQRFAPTRLGRLAVRHFLTPATILRLRDGLTGEAELTFFDLLLLATASAECEPVLPVDFEELEQLAAALAGEASTLLQLPHPQLVARLGINGKRLLATLKMALVIRQWTRLGDTQPVAETFACYPFEVAQLGTSLERLLLVMAALFEKPEVEAAAELQALADYVPLAERITALRTMVATGLDETAVTLTCLSGLGPTLAQRLYRAGITDIEALAQAEPTTLAALRGIGAARAAQWIDQAIEVVKTRSALRYREIGTAGKPLVSTWPSEIDPYRLRRALDLAVRSGEGGSFRITGGLEPHRVLMAEGTYRCDCTDTANGHLCKHVLAVRLAQGDKRLKQLVQQLTSGAEPTQLDLFALWFRPTP